MKFFSFKRIIQISRFPHFWFSTTGFLLWGAMSTMLTVGQDTSWNPVFPILFFWFIFPANVFLNALNDAFDYETDLHNPRKQSLESTVRKDGMAEMLWISFLALASALFILPYVSVLVRWLILLWALIVIVYNVPPIRLKQYPIVDILFGGVGHFATIGIIGYTAVSGSLPPLSLALLGILFCAGQHTFGASFDAPYDRSAGIQNTTARLGSIKNGLMLSIFFYLASAVYAFFIGLPLFSVFVLVFPALIFYNIRKGDLEGRSVSIFQESSWLTLSFGFIMGTLLYWV